MKMTIAVVGFCLTVAGMSNTQDTPLPLKHGVTAVEQMQPTGMQPVGANITRTSQPSFYKRKSEWREIIDSTWGPGLPRAQKLSVFDYYANYVRKNNPTFTFTRLNWDSVSAYWRSKITDSTSRGGFSAILSYLARQLTDLHAFAHDSVLLSTPLNPGTPILVDGQYDFLFAGGDSRFGAGLTPLPDSSLLVYVVAPNHPLGLDPGDIVLGYEGVPWRKIVRELTAAEIPVMGPSGTCPSASAHYMLYCAGMNWHLFDTIDVVKYKTGQTVHLRTDTLLTLNVATPFVNGAQIPVGGVPMPGWSMKDGFPNSPAVTYGIVQGTNIGYIYVYHGGYGNVGAEFNAAVAALAHTHGLIIDIRFNAGGGGLVAGIARLTGYAGPTLVQMARSSPTDLWSLTPMYSNRDIPQDHMRYEHPIAVLLGPTCASGGDVTARQLTYLDNVRFFGKPPNAACGGSYSALPYYAGFDLLCADVTMVDHGFPNTPLWGQEFPIDEQVWLTRDGVAKGEDDVVKRARAWITTLSYAYDVRLSQPSRDTLRITARVENPLAHTLKVLVTLRDDLGALIDSVALKDDGLHSDGAANDGIWGCMYVPGVEGTIHASIRTDDPTAGTSRTLLDIAQFIFARGALIALDANTTDLGRISNTSALRDTTFTVRNIGFAPDSLTILIDLVVPSAPDSAVAVFPTSLFLAAHDSQRVTVRIRPTLLPPAYYTAGILVQPQTGVGQGSLVKALLFQIVIAGGIEDLTGIPKEFALQQNYPNPFNPSTTIRYGLPNRSQVTLAVFNTLGQQVAQLVNGEQEAGYHEVTFDGSRLASGVYLYRMQAGSYVETRKLLLVR
jgi:hypothetical protein